MYRLVMSDMDETFLDEHHRIPAANVRALERMHELGIRFAPSSGRPYASIADNLAALPPHLLEDLYIVSYNGGFINRYGDSEPLTRCGITPQAAEALYRLGLERGLCVHIYTEGGDVYACDAPDGEHRYLASLSFVRFFESNAHPTLSFLAGTNVVKVIFMSEDFDELKRVGGELDGVARDLGLETTYSSGRYLEFMPAGVDKGAGLRRLAALLEIPLEQCVGVGDSANDLAMIEAAGLGVGVANVTDDVRPFCDAVLETTGMAGAFEELVERYLEPAANEA